MAQASQDRQSYAVEVAVQVRQLAAPREFKLPPTLHRGEAGWNAVGRPLKRTTWRG